MQEGTLDIQELVDLLDALKFRTLKEKLSILNPPDIAEFFEHITMPQVLAIFRMLEKEHAAAVFAFLTPDKQALIIDGINDIELQGLVFELFVDDTVDMLEELPASVVKRVLKNTSPQKRDIINQFLQYSEDSAGSVMTSEYIRLKKNMTAAQALEHIRKVAADSESIYNCYVTDDKRHLEGSVSIKQLILCPPDETLDTLIDSQSLIFTTTSSDKESVIDSFTKYDLISMPVVDKENRLVGIITIDDVVSVMQEESAEDMEIMAAITPSEQPYLKTSVFTIWKQRIPWLLLMMVSATITGSIIASFEASLQLFPALIAFIPMLMGTGGNAGAQASVTVIKGLALNELGPKNVPAVITKELFVSLLCGTALAVCNFVKILLVDNLLLHSEVSIMAAATVCVTLLLVVVCAKLIGCILPIVAKRLGLDPAVMASPFITTIVDAISLVIYFQVAMFLLF